MEMLHPIPLRKSLKGIILDMDGVITNTRGLHYSAWKFIFERFFQSLHQPCVFSENDYQLYVDGKPREEGIRAYLASQNIHIENAEVTNLGQEKNEKYLSLVSSSDTLVFEEVPQVLTDWKSEGIPLAVITSSKNARELLNKAQLTDCFQVILDSVEGEKLGLKGKPSPDYFLEAAKRLGLHPEECVVVEDSIVGVEAGITGHFHDVIGVSRDGQTPTELLLSSGADSVIHSLSEMAHIPNALGHWDEIKFKLSNKEIILFLDYDGTLTDIAEAPDKAHLSEEVRSILHRLSCGFKLVIMSGRDRENVKELVGLENVFYAGCHGLDMSGPGCFHFSMDEVISMLPQLQLATMEVMTGLSSYRGVLVERKKFSTAVHYRMVDLQDQSIIRQIVEAILGRYPHLKLKSGKKVIELYPNVSWDKGAAFRKILRLLTINERTPFPIYIGDDDTDEDVFRILGHDEIGIRVDETGISTWGRYFLSSPKEVKEFLLLVDQQFNGQEKRWTRGF